MYHISDDPRAQRSAMAIYEALKACLARKSLDQVSVSDLQKESGIARSTFYHSFDNVTDVLHWRCAMAFQEVYLTYTRPRFMGEFDLARHFVEYWIDHSEVLELLLQAGRMDIIQACHQEMSAILFNRYDTLPEGPPAYAQYYMSVRTGFTVSVLAAWLKGGKREGAEEIVNIIRTIFEYLQHESDII